MDIRGKGEEGIKGEGSFKPGKRGKSEGGKCGGVSRNKVRSGTR